MKRRLRKHRAALVAIAVYNLVLFFPVLFMGRVLSPNDVLYGIDPWAQQRPSSVVNIQNPALTDVPTTLLADVALLRDSPSALRWNPYIAAGIAGLASGGSHVLTPFVLLPALLVPLTWLYTAIVFLKFNAAFLFAYAWLREERMGKRAAAAGAIVAAGAGVLAVRWLVPMSSAAALYPLLLWLVRRAFASRRTPVAVLAVALVAYGLSASPSAMVYGAYLAASYAVFLVVRFRRLPWRQFAAAAVAVVIALLITAPVLVPFGQDIRDRGYLGIRAETSEGHFYPASQLKSFISPERLGNPAYRNWLGDKELGKLNSFVEATVYLGLLTLPLALAGFANRRQWWMQVFWVAAAALALGAMFGVPKIAGISRVPGLDYSPLSRLALVLPVIAAFLVASGTSVVSRLLRRVGRSASWYAVALLVAVLAADLAHFAGRFQPYVLRDDAEVPRTATMEFLQAQNPPFRIAPTFNYLWPNSAAFYQVEDIRSRFTLDQRYRKLLQRIDPTSAGSVTTPVQFNSLKFNYADPLVGMLGVRYVVEHPSIDILKWGTFDATVPVVAATDFLQLQQGVAAARNVVIADEPFYAIELSVSIDQTRAAKPHLEVSLAKNGTVVWTRSVEAEQIRVMNKVYVPVRPFARTGEVVRLTVRPIGMTVRMGSGAAPEGESPIAYGRVTTPVIFERQLRDGRLFLHAGELPRFRPSTRLMSMSDDEFLANKSIDFATDAAITSSPQQVNETFAPGARVTLLSWRPDEQRVRVEAAAPAFVSTSEKLSRDLRVTIDGKPAEAVEINMVFAGVRVPAGTHEIVFSRRPGARWMPFAIAGVVALLVIAALEIIAARRR